MIGEAEILQAVLDANSQAGEFGLADDRALEQGGVDPGALIRVARLRAMTNLKEETNMRTNAALMGVPPRRIAAEHLVHMLTAAWAEGCLTGVRLGRGEE